MYPNNVKHITTVVTFFLLLTFYKSKAQNEEYSSKELSHFKELIYSRDHKVQQSELEYIDANWKPAYEIMVLELFYLKISEAFGRDLLQLLQKKTGESYGYNFNAWYQWIWEKEESLIPEYHKFKAAIHGQIDVHFPKYFRDRQTEDKRTIRLDEVRWGGVGQDGIPPLRNPKMIKVNEARYLKDDHIVFGVEVNGDFRAYPKRILAWHEMFTDTIGGVDVAGVYCTLCGTVVLYKTTHNGVKHSMGTSGFLYRSNKLMYDKETQSLWNTLWGKPVIGPLVGKGIELDYLSVVTTTWGEWKKNHPKTKVLAIDTGFRRDYNEGVAYNKYFSTDELMFNVPKVDHSLKNKQSVLGIRFPKLKEKPLAISVKFLKNNPIYTDEIGTHKFVVFTDKTGANRVFETLNDIQFKKYDKENIVIDNKGEKWIIHENKLEKNDGTILKRIHTFNAFWFGWKAAFPETRLVK